MVASPRKSVDRGAPDVALETGCSTGQTGSPGGSYEWTSQCHHAQRQGLVFLEPDDISSVDEISGGTEITLTVLSFAVVVALLATIIRGLANICDALRKKLVRGFLPSSSTR